MEKIDKFQPISEEEKLKWENIVINEYNSHLFGYSSIKLPQKDNNKFLQLLYLRIHQGNLVSKEALSEFVRYYNNKASVDQQTRHLGSQDHFYVLNKNDKIPNKDIKVPSGYHILINLEQPHPKLIHSELKRLGRIASQNFEELKTSYNNRCATCNSQEGKPHFKNPAIKTELQQGHMNPSKELSLDNTIPQCQLCNQSYKDNYVFDKNGRVIAVAAIEPVAKAENHIQEKIFEFLKDMLKK